MAWHNALELFILVMAEVDGSCFLTWIKEEKEKKECFLNDSEYEYDERDNFVISDAIVTHIAKIAVRISIPCDCSHYCFFFFFG
jgi:phosphoenolpyruvate synthase/pyruvate phosphate dikinase